MKCMIHEDGRRELVESPSLVPQAGECVFEVKACGICGSDLSRVFGRASYYYPIVLGHEFAGVVKDSTDPALIGRRACVFPILPCGTCLACRKEMWASCVKYDYYGSRRDGGMQSSLLIREKNLLFLPSNVDFEAGAMAEPAAVCLHAVKKTNITSDSAVLIFGAGTIGLLCAMWAKTYGARAVYVSDPDEKRLDFAQKLGFAVCPCEDLVQFDAIIEASGASAALNRAIRCAKPMGTVVLVGHGKHDTVIGEHEFSMLLRKQLTLVGSWNSDLRGDANDWQEALDAIAAGRIDPKRLITHRIPLEKADDAFYIIGGKQEFYNKIMVVNDR